MRLVVSHDAGISYQQAATGTLEELKAYIVAHPELDGLRWWIRDEKDKPDYSVICPVCAFYLRALGAQVHGFPQDEARERNLQ